MSRAGPPRRVVLRAAVGGLAALGLGSVTAGCTSGVGGTSGGATRSGSPVFTLGVASGDPAPDGMVL
ncbi:MAG: hypothetical protein ACR2G2_18390 [Pseudonocardia sp.]